MKILHVIIVLICLLLSSCATRSIVPEPGKITLEQALKSVGTGLVEMKKAQVTANGDKPFKTGLLPSEVEVTFNVTASATDTGKLYVELTETLASGSATAGAEASSSKTASRGNQITIKFQNVAFATTTIKKDGTKIVTGVTDPEKLQEIYAVLDNAGAIVFLQPPDSPANTQ